MNSRLRPSPVTSLKALAVALVLSLLMAPGLALAAAPTSAEVLVILAKEEGPSDPELQKIKALQRPPFSSYKSKKLLKKHRVEVATDKPASIELPNGQQLQLLKVSDKADGRIELQVSIIDPKKQDKKPVLQVKALASPGDPFFIAGQKFEGGTLFIGVQIGAAK